MACSCGRASDREHVVQATFAKARAAIARAPREAFDIATIEVEPPREKELLVRIAGVGLCHTDLIFRDQFLPYPQPAVLGHEGAGTVEAVGPGVVDFGVGDEVILAFSACRECPSCDSGLPSYCRDFVPLNYAGARSDGSTAYRHDVEEVASHFFGQSSFSELAVVRAVNAVPVPDTDLDISLLGPLGCGIQTGAGAILRSMNCDEGSSIAIWGGGAVGQAAVMAARLKNMDPIILIEPMGARRSLACGLGSTHTIDPGGQEVIGQIRSIAPEGVAYALDTSGNAAALQDAVGSLTIQGLLGLVGVPPTASDTLNINLAQQITSGLRTMGIVEGDSDPRTFLPELLAYHSEGRFPFDRLITSYPLERINDAIEAQARGECVKAVMIP